MPLAVVLILLVVGSLVFHVLSPWTFTPLASNWGLIDFTIDITFWVTGAVFVAVNLFMAYCVIKFRYKKDARATYEPENKKLETWLTALTAVGVAAMLTPGLFVWADFVNVPEDAHEVEAVGQQWHWSYRYPGDDGRFGEVDAERISADNPFGMDPDDPNGQDDVLVMHPEARLPINKPVKFLLRSKDVLHDFAIAQFRVKMDLVPGMETFLWLTPTELGRFELLCEELCGIAHHTMRGAVIVEEQDDFDAWLAAQATYSEINAQPAGNAAVGAAQYAVCAACHGQQGEGLAALNAPKIAGQDAWYMKRQLQNYKSGSRGAHPDDTFGKQMAPMAAMLLDDTAINNVIAHIQTFPDEPAPATIEGNVANGAKLYNICAYCHGAAGQGIQAMNAPRAAGMTDWYLARQLQNFKDGVRGAHPTDFYGFQMGLMANVLHDEQAINDLVAYINTL
ncbi:MAG: c-type cytochrome [Gammaproteobacteria bacterium]|jgi:cytochrome c oxidase subunit 2|nr:c-type cytochrome [Gammaproteobacteria bacterium]MDH3751689.1 c-type cytochrome [Gammaproteobacteria bacterium]MDH3804338.1 c-type cytochrome [Gammaproteobacteria bacterium]